MVNVVRYIVDDLRSHLRSVVAAAAATVVFVYDRSLEKKKKRIMYVCMYNVCQYLPWK